MVGAVVSCNYPCEVGAKSSSHVTTIPAAVNTGLFDMRLNHTYSALILTASGKATGVRYYDATGKVHIQPAKVVFNGLWGYNLIRAMLLSGMGRPYDPVQSHRFFRKRVNLWLLPINFKRKCPLDIGANTYCSGNGSGGGYAIMDLNEVNPD